MEKKNIALSSAQIALIELLKHSEVEEYYEALKTLHYLGTYVIDKELVDLEASACVHQLLDAVHNVVLEKPPVIQNE